VPRLLLSSFVTFRQSLSVAGFLPSFSGKILTRTFPPKGGFFQIQFSRVSGLPNFLRDNDVPEKTRVSSLLFSFRAVKLGKNREDFAFSHDEHWLEGARFSLLVAKASWGAVVMTNPPLSFPFFTGNSLFLLSCKSPTKSFSTELLVLPQND